ncbi:hypothetical protein GCM10028818_41290 [Spirosoma horti]
MNLIFQLRNFIFYLYNLLNNYLSIMNPQQVQAQAQAFSIKVHQDLVRSHALLVLGSLYTIVQKAEAEFNNFIQITHGSHAGGANVAGDAQHLLDYFRTGVRPSLIVVSTQIDVLLASPESAAFVARINALNFNELYSTNLQQIKPLIDELSKLIDKI